MIDNIVASLDRNPRRLRIIYVYPKSADYLLGTGRFELERKMRAPRPALHQWHEVLVFRSQASGAAR